MSAQESNLGPKLRLNVSAVNVSAAEVEVDVGKFLVLINEGVYVSDLEAKVRGVLAKGGVAGRLLRLDNALSAHLPHDELVRDVLRDGEEVVAVVVQEQAPNMEPVRVDDLLNFSQGAVPRATPPRSPLAFAEPVALRGTPQSRSPRSPRIHGEVPPAGPQEHFVGDESSHNLGACDWEVGGLTPKLREFVSTRFKEVHGQAADPMQSFISVSMRPRDRSGPNLAMHPVHYSIARIDVIEFERLCGRKVQEARKRLDYFLRCSEALGSLVDRGASEAEYAPNMLPYRYRADEEFGGLLEEADSCAFGQLEGFRPVIVVDTSGAVGDALPFIRSALKRILYSFIVAKSKFNMIKFSSQGRPVAFEGTMVPPTAQKLREAEEWLDAAKPCRQGCGGQEFIDGMQMAMDMYEADTVYVLTAGFPRRADADHVLREVASRNVKQLPVHVIGIDCDTRAELDLRRLADENQGRFRQKRFDGGLCLGEQGFRRSAGGMPHDDARLTIGGQLCILEIMASEQDAQTADWLDEQRCANRLLLTTATQQPVPTERREARANLAPLGQPRLQELLEHLPRRRGGQQPAQRANSLSRRASGKLSQTAAELRRPSISNPWDRPSGVVKVSGIGDSSERSLSMLSARRQLSHAR